MVNCIKKIKIENIKGKKDFEIEFTDFVANQPNIVVAPNGYGKSTITKAFEASSNGKIKINKQDLYLRDEANKPKLEIELIGEEAGIYTSTDAVGDISTHISICTINSPIYAKNTSRRFGGNVISNADLRIESVIVYEKIPNKYEVEYSFQEMKNIYKDKKRLFLNLKNILNDYENLKVLHQNMCLIKKCLQKREQKKLQDFLNALEIDDRKEFENSDNILKEMGLSTYVNDLCTIISNLNNIPDNWHDFDAIFTLIQICHLTEKSYEKGGPKFFEKASKYLEYTTLKTLIDERLKLFNTTSFNYKTQIEKGKLIIKFERAAAMSNGERDILSFISNLSKFEINYKHKLGVLIIDEVFDYLDGSNMLAVQYYLSELIANCKKSGKILYPIIFTHLDPGLFGNYYFNKKKLHYISIHSSVSLDNPAIKILRLRESKDIGEEIKNEIEKYYLHYIDEEHSPSKNLSNEILPFDLISNYRFKKDLYDEIKNKYLKDLEYNSIMVVLGIRIRIEELACSKLNLEQIKQFIETHKTVNKLDFATECGILIPELYYLLQPLYNDGAHLNGDDKMVINKVKASCLKTNNKIIQSMVSKLFIEE